MGSILFYFEQFAISLTAMRACKERFKLAPGYTSAIFVAYTA
jgi:hypothetical protein